MDDAESRRGSHQLMPLAQIDSSEHDGVRLVAVAGELDVSNVGALEDATFDLPNDGLGVVLDLSCATYIDSATLGVLFRLRRGLQRRGQSLRVVCAPESNVRRVLDLTGFDGGLAEEELDTAIASLRSAVPIRDGAA
jgi:anti-anti-sigma factor